MPMEDCLTRLCLGLCFILYFPRHEESNSVIIAFTEVIYFIQKECLLYSPRPMPTSNLVDIYTTDHRYKPNTDVACHAGNVLTSIHHTGESKEAHPKPPG